MINNQLLNVGVRVYTECLRHLLGRIEDARCKRRWVQACSMTLELAVVHYKGTN